MSLADLHELAIDQRDQSDIFQVCSFISFWSDCG
jgi:hypothetical protein